MSHSKTNGIPEGWKAENGMHVITDLNDPAFLRYLHLDDLDLELFAGPGGFSEGRKLALGESLRSLGFEWDASACMTATAAGHPRVHADLTQIHPSMFKRRVRGIHGSPPCQGFSPAGKGEGRHDMELLVKACRAMAAGRDPDEVMEILRRHVRDPKSALALEPLRWALILRPEWVTMEQVKTVLPLWVVIAETLRARGYSAHASIVTSEQYGVPQTRERAIVLASLVHDVEGGLEPTHSKYHRHPSKRSHCDPGVLPWISMAQALGWGMTQRPYVTIAVGTKSGGTDPQALGGSGARRTVATEQAEGRWINKPEAANEGTTDEDMAWVYNRPSPTIVSSFRPEVVAAPKYRKPGDGPRQKAKGSVRISVQEAGIIQSFPADYPWQGLMTKQYEQVGNAVPPLLGQAMIETVTGLRAAKQKAA